MVAPRKFLAVIVALSLGGLSLLAWQREEAARLREAIARQRGDVGEMERLLVERQRLIAAQVSPEELQRLRVERNAVSALLGEIEGMKRRAEATNRATKVRTATAESKSMAPSLKGRPVASDLWQNAGQSTPDSAFQTALWASTGGDIESLAAVLVVDAEVRAKAQALFAQLPLVLRSEIGTPDRFLALLTAKDILPGSAQILAQYPLAGGVKIAARLFDPEGKPKQLLLTMRAEGDSWRLVVPATVVEKYATQLRIPNALK